MTSRLQARLLAQRALFQRLNANQKPSRLNAGFTLIELLVVIVIVGILSAIAIPSFLNQRNRAYEASGRSWAAGEARKCSAAQAAGASSDFTSTSFPSGISPVTASATGDCTSTFAWGVQGGPSGTRTYTVDSAGGITISGS
jgi:type IV pilus assembly protein PilA